MAFDAVLFDMDGTLIDSERVWQEGLTTVAGDVPGVDAFCRSIVGVHVDGVLDLLATWLPQGWDVAQVLQDWEAETFARLERGAPLKPGARDLIGALQARALPLAVVTSSGRDHACDILTKVGLMPSIGALVARDDVAHPKPHPQPYLMGAEALDVAISRCVAFEDSPVGVQSAVASGAVVVQVPDVIAPDADLRKLGHLVLPDLLTGARKVGLL